jgi:nicotinamide-nucleotide amidase
MRAEIIAIGDELTTGQRPETNSRWLSERLVDMGVDVAFHTVVGDDLENCTAAIRTAIDRADVVVMTGGLGPTADDLTREAIAIAVGADLVQNREVLEHIRAMFARRGWEMSPRNILQANFPCGSQPVPNPYGTAPGIAMTVARECCLACRLFALPGVPAEMFAMWTAAVGPAIAAAQPVPRVTRHRRIKCFGAGESDIEAMLPNLIRRDRQPLVGITVSNATITLRITASGPSEEACRLAMEPTVAQIRQSLGVLVFGEEDDELQDVVVRLLDEHHKTAAVAEWGTDGLATQWLAGAAAASGCFLGGIVVRDAAALASLLGVEAPVRSDNAVNQPSATVTADVDAMVCEIRSRTGADYGLAVAMIPTEEQPASAAGVTGPQGTLHVALAMGENVRRQHWPLAGHPGLARARAAKQALNVLRLALLRGEAADR